MVHRRSFVKQLLGAGMALPLAPLLESCGTERYHYPIRISSPDVRQGHRLRDGWLAAPVETIRTRVAIIGGGVSGLSALRRLRQQGEEEVLLLEMENETGGNARGGEMMGARFPYGAHYLPIPDPDDQELMVFLQEAGVISGKNDRQEWLYREDFLCRSPHERLLFRGKWKDGLVPGDLSMPETMREIDRFFDLMESYKSATVASGNWLFRLPMGEEVYSPEAVALDQRTFADFLLSQGFRSPELLWYIDYCCRDDYGGDARQISAYAGLHYFCSRRGKAGNAANEEVLTWPEGNYYLVNKLRFPHRNHIRHQAMVIKLEMQRSGALLTVADTSSGAVYGVIADKVIVACPGYVSDRLLPEEVRVKDWKATLNYAPWLVANVVMDRLPEERDGADLAWDNVIFGSASLGYIHSSHQVPEVQPDLEVFTWYHTLSMGDWKSNRKKLLKMPAAELWEAPLKELKTIYPSIEKNIRAVDLHIWGHGMICPVPGLLSSVARKQAQLPFRQTIYFAHTDRSGVSLFEEAFHQGLRAADEILKNT